MLALEKRLRDFPKLLMTNDPLSPNARSALMSKIRSKNTSPEIRVRKLIFGLGYRYRLHNRKLPGIPDLVFPGRKKVIFVHGCFWHGHDCGAGKNKPKSNLGYWLPKLAANKERDERHIVELNKAGWDVLVIWECQTKKSKIRELVPFIKDFLG